MRDPRFTVAALVIGLCGAVPHRALAGGPASSGLPLPSDGFGLLASDRAPLEEAGSLLLRLDTTWLHAPLRLPVAGTPLTRSVVDDEIVLRAGLALGLSDFLEVGVSLPLSFASYSSDGQRLQSGAGKATGRDFASGDLRAFLKLDLARWRGLRAALLAGASLPSGDSATFRSDGRISGEPRLVIDWRIGRLGLVANLGARLHDFIVVANDAGCTFTIGSELTYSGALTVAVGRFLLALEGAGSEQLTSHGCDGGAGDGAFSARQRTRAALASIAFEPGPGVSLFVGAGVPLFDGEAARSGSVRAVAGFAWSPSAAAAQGVRPDGTRGSGDRDGDGISDAHDACPDEPEDMDGFQDDDGCPDPDNDQDGVPDDKDQCPLVAEDRDNFQDDDGCPDPDNDQDGIPDDKDRCPDEAEPQDGFQDGDGCPDDDIDKDGVPNLKDACPFQPGPATNYGCPETHLLPSPVTPPTPAAPAAPARRKP